MKHRIAATLLAVFGLSAGLNVQAAATDIVSAAEMQELADIIQSLGYRAKLETDNVGDPVIHSSAAGAEFQIQTFGCDSDSHDNCKLLLFKVGFDLEEGTTLESMNDWNEQVLVGRAYIDDEMDPWLEWAVNMDGGVTEKNFAESFDWWETALAQFLDHINF